MDVLLAVENVGSVSGHIDSQSRFNQMWINGSSMATFKARTCTLYYDLSD